VAGVRFAGLSPGQHRGRFLRGPASNYLRRGAWRRMPSLPLHCVSPRLRCSGAAVSP